MSYSRSWTIMLQTSHTKLSLKCMMWVGVAQNIHTESTTEKVEECAKSLD